MGGLFFRILITVIKGLIPWIEYGVDAYKEEQTGRREYTGDDTSLSGGALWEDAEAMRMMIDYEKEKQEEEMRRIEERYRNRNLDPDMPGIKARGVIEPLKDEDDTAMDAVPQTDGTLAPFEDDNGDSFDKGFMDNV